MIRSVAKVPLLVDHLRKEHHFVTVLIPAKVWITARSAVLSVYRFKAVVEVASVWWTHA